MEKAFISKSIMESGFNAQAAQMDSNTFWAYIKALTCETILILQLK
jgi:hypothetical protein